MHNHKSLKIILLSSLLLMLIIFVAYYFVYKDIKYKNQNYQSLQRDLSFQNDKQQYLASKQETINSIGLDINRLESTIISKDGDVAFIENLESMARESGLSIHISSLSFDSKSKLASSSVGILNIKTTTEGSWSGNYTFLARLESMPVKTKINMVSFSNVSSADLSDISKGGTTSSIWQGVFDIDVLKYK